MTAADLTSGPSKPYPVNDRTGADDEVWLSELQRIEDEPAAPESLRERVAEALLIAVLGSDEGDLLTGWEIHADEVARLIVEYGADAALAVIRGQQ